MNKKNVQFEGSQGDQLDAYISYPLTQKPNHYAIFAHCFTCNKNFSAVRNIVEALNQNGFGVLSFDFTGLGKSGGDFAESNFSSTIEDIIAASNYLKETHKAPEILVGHSLGGTAVLYAASEVESVRAVASIGSPSSPEHVKNLFVKDIEGISDKGEKVVNIGGRNFKIKNQFLEDLEKRSENNSLERLRKPLMLFHSPQDQIVGIENARELYESAHHPKSFISLDGADHLLSQKDDSFYVGNTLAAWAARYLPTEEKEQTETEAQTVATIGKQEEGLTTYVLSEGHALTVDEPTNIGGNNFGPSPYGLLTAALASCTAITLRMYANRKKWDLSEVNVHVDQSHRHANDSENCEEEGSKITVFERQLELKGNLTAEQKDRLIEIAKRCPVHKTLESKIEVI